EIGETLVDSFMETRNELRENFLLYCLIETIKLDSNLKTFNVWNFFYRLLLDPQTAFNKAIDHYYNDSDNADFVKPLVLSPKFYYWVLTKFGTDAQITALCFESILLIRVSIDQQLKLTPDLNIPIGMSQYAFKETCNIFKVYCNAKNFFRPSHLDLISQCFSIEILGTLFGHYLPSLFNLEITFPLPMQITDGETNQYDIVSPSRTKKRTKRCILKEWEQKLQSMFDNRSEPISIFQNYLSEFWGRKLYASEIKREKEMDIRKYSNNTTERVVRQKQRKKRRNETN
ncbi:8593_t:CDS:1, partial [Dentiscutata erythropus]